VDGKDLKADLLPESFSDGNVPQIIPPSSYDFKQIIHNLKRKYRHIVIILMSSQISPPAKAAKEAADSLNDYCGIHLIDSKTTGAGLGLLVQHAAEAASRGMEVKEISRDIRGLTNRIYSIFCIQGLTYLHHSGHLDPAQAIVGEMLGLLPCFFLENGKFTPLEKIRSSRHLLEVLQEFIHEFNELSHIAYIHGAPPNEQTARIFKERAGMGFPKAAYSEHHIGGALAAMIGPRSLGVAAMEIQNTA
jgi:DegV family protein with EDD domain